MANPNFSSILDTPATDVKPPALVPAGSYTALVKGLPEYGKSSKKGTEQSKHTLQLLQAHEDVDEEDLEEYGPLVDRTIDVIYYHTDKSLFMLTDFCKNCGLDLEGMTIKQAIEATPGCQVGVFIRHEPSPDGERMFARVARTFAVS